MLFSKATNTQAYLKAGFMGFAGDGKTFTATRLAIGLVELMRERDHCTILCRECGGDYVMWQDAICRGDRVMGIRIRPTRGVAAVANRAFAVPVEPHALSYQEAQARRSLAEYHHRLARHIDGGHFPDPRDQELRDRGVELGWRFAVARRSQARIRPPTRAVVNRANPSLPRSMPVRVGGRRNIDRAVRGEGCVANVCADFAAEGVR